MSMMCGNYNVYPRALNFAKLHQCAAKYTLAGYSDHEYKKGTEEYDKKEHIDIWSRK